MGVCVLVIIAGIVSGCCGTYSAIGKLVGERSWMGTLVTNATNVEYSKNYKELFVLLFLEKMFFIIRVRYFYEI